MARHSSSAILTYLDNVHASHLGNIAAEASSIAADQSRRTMSKDLSLTPPSFPSFQAETKAEVSRRPPAGSSPPASKVIEPAEEDEECRTEPSMGRPCAYVLSAGTHGRVHVCRPSEVHLTWRNWSWTKHNRAKTYTKCPSCKMCVRCTRACLKEQTEPHVRTCSNDSSSSNSDSDESES